jgi:hypothetical protein
VGFDDGGLMVDDCAQDMCKPTKRMVCDVRTLQLTVLSGFHMVIRHAILDQGQVPLNCATEPFRFGRQHLNQ